MIAFNYTITDRSGIHARPAAELVKAIKDFTSSVTITKGAKTTDARKIFGLIGLGAKMGEEILVQIEGEDEACAAAVLECFLEENL